MDAGASSATATPCPPLCLGGPADGSLYLLLPLAIPAGGSLVLTPAHGTNSAWILSLSAESKNKTENSQDDATELSGTPLGGSKRRGNKVMKQEESVKDLTAQDKGELKDPKGFLCSKANSYKCSDCGKSYRRSTDLLRHQRSHTGERPYLCLDCGKSFSRSSILLEHQRIHTGEKPYRCSHCGQGFSQSSNRNQHEKTHSREKLGNPARSGPSPQRTEGQKRGLKSLMRAAECSGSGEGSLFPAGNLPWNKKVAMMHQRSPLVEKPYRCPQCEKCFARSTDFIRHHITHTGEKPYTCVKCGKSFTRSSVLIEHKRIHTGERPYKCRLCGKGFSQSSNRNQHETIHQAVKPPKHFLNGHNTLNWGMGLPRQQTIHTAVGKA